MDLNALCGSGLGSFEMLEKLKGFYSLNHQHLKTGVSFIDSVTNGGLILGMTVLGGMPNVGKSTLLVQVAVELCKKGTPVVYVNKDMRAEEVMLKAVSYISAMPFLSETYSVTDISKVYSMGNDIADDVRLEVVQFCERLHVIDIDDAKWSDIGVARLSEKSALGRVIEAYCSYYKESPVFIIDSLQSIAVSADRNSKESMDLVLSEIRCLQRKYNVRVVLVSNFNRGSYDKPADLLSFKESGSIEYFSDCVLALDFADKSQKARKSMVRKVNLVNLKDRVSEHKELALKFDVLKSTFYAASSDDATLVIPAIPAAPESKAQKAPDTVYDMDAMFGVADNKSEDNKFSSFEDFLKS